MLKDIVGVKADVLPDNSKVEGTGIKKQSVKGDGTINNNTTINYYMGAMEKYVSNESGDSKMKYMLDVIKKSELQIKELENKIKKYQDDTAKTYKAVTFSSDVMEWNPDLEPERINAYLTLKTFDSFISCDIDEYDYSKRIFVIYLNEYSPDFAECLKIADEILNKFK
jgi:hypothetical protein